MVELCNFNSGNIIIIGRTRSQSQNCTLIGGYGLRLRNKIISYKESRVKKSSKSRRARNAQRKQKSTGIGASSGLAQENIPSVSSGRGRKRSREEMVSNDIDENDVAQPASKRQRRIVNETALTLKRSTDEMEEDDENADRAAAKRQRQDLLETPVMSMALEDTGSSTNDGEVGSQNEGEPVIPKSEDVEQKEEGQKLEEDNEGIFQKLTTGVKNCYNEWVGRLRLTGRRQ